MELERIEFNDDGERVQAEFFANALIRNSVFKSEWKERYPDAVSYEEALEAEAERIMKAQKLSGGMDVFREIVADVATSEVVDIGGSTEEDWQQDKAA